MNSAAAKVPMDDPLSLRESMKLSLAALDEADASLRASKDQITESQARVAEARSAIQRGLLALTHVAMRAKEAARNANDISTAL